MNEQLHFSWEVVVDNVVQQWDINTTSCEVCDNQIPDKLPSESNQAFFTSALIHCTINKDTLKASFRDKLMQVLNVVPGCSENNGLLFCLDMLIHNIK